METLIPEAVEPVATGVDPVAADEVATEATGLGEVPAGVEGLGAEPPVVEVMKPDATADAEVVTGMMVRTSERVLVATAEELAIGECEDAAGAGDDAAGAGEDAAGAEALVPPPTEPDATEPEADPPPIPFTAAHVPEKPTPLLADVPVTSGPGLGKTTSSVSIVVQPFSKFATKRSGRDLKATEAALFLEDPAPIVIDAQFM